MLSRALWAGLAAALASACVTEPARETPRGLPRPQISIAGGGGTDGETDILLGDVAIHYSLSNKVVLGGRMVGYRYSQEINQEETAFGRELETTRTSDGKGLGLGPELRIYPIRSFDGLWLGGGLLWFPYNTAEGELRGTDLETGIRFRTESQPIDVRFAGYGAIGWTFRTGTPLSVGIELDIGLAEQEVFGGALLRLGYEL